MLPTTNACKVSRRAPRDPRPGAGAAPDRPSATGTDGRERLEPIGKARLRELREAIENGTYPPPADVLGGLDRLFGLDDE